MFIMVEDLILNSENLLSVYKKSGLEIEICLVDANIINLKGNSNDIENMYNSILKQIKFYNKEKGW